MDKELLTTLGLDPDKDLKSLLEDLEGKQYEFFERLETTNDEHRREELNGLLSRIDIAIGQIKNQIASVNSGIILDLEPTKADAAEEKKKKKEQKEKEKEKEKAQEKAKEAQLAAQVQALKEKEEARRKQEAEAKAKAEAEAKAKAEAEAKAKAEAEAKAKQQAQAQPPMTDLQQGLLRYQKGNFKEAFPIFKQLAEKNDTTAQYMLACMYSRGEGTASDRERAEFWMKKAADNGDPVAQFDYAVFLLSDQNRDDTKTATGLHYMQRSADQGHKDAMERYVELVEKGTGGLHELTLARRYCLKLVPLVADSYDKQKVDDVRRSLRVRQRKLRRRRFGRAASSLTSATGALILMVPTILIFTGYHQEFLRTLPQINQLPAMVQAILFGFWYPGSVMVNIAAPEDVLAWLTLPVQNALMMIFIGWMLKGAGNKENRNGLSTAVVRIGCFLRYLAIGGHIALCMFLETDMVANAYINLGAILVVIIVARIAGSILGKILGTKIQ